MDETTKKKILVPVDGSDRAQIRSDISAGRIHF